MKYESSILKRLIDTYGVIGNPRYLSEIIKEFIVRGKELYPQLFTYQSDWLAHIDEFGLTPEYTVSYTGQHIYAPNTREKPVKRAILKGNTLVNIYDIKTSSSATQGVTINDTTCTLTATSSWVAVNNKLPMLQPSKTYTIIVNIIENTLQYSNTNYNYALQLEVTDNNTGFSSGYEIPRGSIGIFKRLLTTKSELTTSNLSDVRIPPTATSGNIKFTYMIIEGDHIQDDIPYFTGMQSVKMPVLTTVGKNLFDKNNVYENGFGINGYTKDRKGYDIKVQPNTLYTITAKGSLHYGFFNDDTKISSSYFDYNTIGNKTITTPTNCNILKLGLLDKGITTDVDFDTFQIEEGSVATPYEPYKTNILSCLEPVELGSVGNVIDTLDLLTGEVVKKTKEVVLNGSENGWNTSWNDNVVPLDNFFTCGINLDGKIRGGAVVDKFSQIQLRDESEGFISNAGSDNEFAIRVSKDKLETQDLKGFKKYLSQNPITVRYQLATPTIKTVDLSILDQNENKVSQLSSFNGGTHFSTSSQEGSLQPSIIVDVVTDLEETLSLCSMDGNTL